VILPPFWAARPAPWFGFAESNFREKPVVSQWRYFDLLSAAMPEKVLDVITNLDRQVVIHACKKFWS
jgi:hypothetical protein